MKNNIASFEKTSSSEVKFWTKIAKINSAWIFSIMLAPGDGAMSSHEDMI